MTGGTSRSSHTLASDWLAVLQKDRRFSYE